MKNIGLALLLFILAAGLHANPQSVAPFNGYNLNAFGVQKVTQAHTLFASKQLQPLSLYMWSISTSGAGGCTEEGKDHVGGVFVATDSAGAAVMYYQAVHL